MSDDVDLINTVLHYIVQSYLRIEILFFGVSCAPKGWTIYSSKKMNRYHMLHQEFNMSVRKPTPHQIEIPFPCVVIAINIGPDERPILEMILQLKFCHKLLADHWER